MPYFYKYLGVDQDLLVESEDPRPDLLEWAYWSEVDAPAKREAKPEPEPEPEPEPVVEPAQAAEPVEPEPEPEPKPATKRTNTRRTSKAA